jgi:hypothetical protein
MINKIATAAKLLMVAQLAFIATQASAGGHGEKKAEADIVVKTDTKASNVILPN